MFILQQKCLKGQMTDRQTDRQTGTPAPT